MTASKVQLGLPLTRVAGASSMWLESAPGGRFDPIDASPATPAASTARGAATLPSRMPPTSCRCASTCVLPRHLACAELARLSPEELAREHRYTLHVWGGGRGPRHGGRAAPRRRRCRRAGRRRAGGDRPAGGGSSGRYSAARARVCPAAHLPLWDAAAEGVRPSDAPAKGPTSSAARRPRSSPCCGRSRRATTAACASSHAYVSEYGVRRERSYGSARELAEAVLAHLPEEESRRLLGDSRARDDGFLLLTSRLHWWRQSAVGHVQCTRCGGFFSGGRGLREHWLGKHGKAYEEAKAEVDAAASTASSRAPSLLGGRSALCDVDGRAERRQQELAELPPAIAAARDGDIDTLRALLKGDFDPAVDTDRHGASAMLWAAGGGHLAVCELLHAPAPPPPTCSRRTLTAASADGRRSTGPRGAGISTFAAGWWRTAPPSTRGRPTARRRSTGRCGTLSSTSASTSSTRRAPTSTP